MKLEVIEKKFRKGEAHIAIVGLGRVGLLTAAVFADAGYHVIGVDVKGNVIKAISLKKICTKEPDLERVARALLEREIIILNSYIQETCYFM